MNCSNCELPTPVAGALVLQKDEHVVACLCPDCQSGVLLGRLVFVRSRPGAQFRFEHYQPVTVAK